MSLDEQAPADTGWDAVEELARLVAPGQIGVLLARRPELRDPGLDGRLTEQIRALGAQDRDEAHTLLAVRAFFEHYATAAGQRGDAAALDDAVRAAGGLPLGGVAPLRELDRRVREEPRDWPRCRELAAWALRLVRKESEPAGWAYAQHVLGDAIESLSDGDAAKREAARHFQAAAEGWRAAGRDEMCARALGALDRVLRTLIRRDPERFSGEGIAGYRAALAICDAARLPKQRVLLLNVLGDLLLGRSDLERTLQIEQAITCYREAAGILADIGPQHDYAIGLAMLGNCYLWRVDGDPEENIELAITLDTQALEIHRAAGRRLDAAKTEFNLAVAYRRRVRPDEAHLARAEECAAHARAVFEDERRGALSVGAAHARALDELLARADAELGTILYLARSPRAVDHYQAALTFYEADGRTLERARILNLLANAWCEQQHGDPARNRHEAVRFYRQAIEIYTPDAYPHERAQVENNLGATFAELAELEPWLRPLHAARAERALRRAGAVRTVEMLPQSARQTNRTLGDLRFAQRRWAAAADAYRVALRATEQRYRASLLRSSKEGGIAEAGDLYHRAAYACAQAARRVGPAECAALLAEAAATLERGRARMLAETLQRDRADLETVAGVDLDAYAAYRRAAEALRDLEGSALAGEGRPVPVRAAEAPAPRHGPPQASSELYERARVARAALEAAIAAIRRHPRFAHFLDEPDLQAVVGPETLVYLVATPAGGLALIVRGEGDAPPSIEPLWLDKLNQQATHSLVAEWTGAYQQQTRDFAGWTATIDRVTRRLWDLGMGRLARKLAPAGRAVLIPSGLLGLLPLHAAWTNESGARRYALDHIVWTYAPSALALMYARRTAAAVPAGWTVIVGEPGAPPSLPNAHAEAAAVAALFQRPHVLRRDEATRQKVRDALRQAQMAHFACHGSAHLHDPLQSGLQLADGTLTARDLFALNLAGARLATLSACETGIIGTRLPDEVVALPAAMLRAGFAGVVASLWAVLDLSTALLMTRFYQLWKIDGLAPADALQQAQIWLRDLTSARQKVFRAQFLPDSAPHEKSEGDVRNDERPFAHPLYWAAFQYVGL